MEKNGLHKKTQRCCFSVKCTCIAIFCLHILPLCAFEWPRLSEDIAVFFAQKRGNGFNRGLIFDNPGEVKAADSGRVLITITSDFENAGYFPSALGNAVIVGHKDQIVTVYGGLEKVNAADENGNISSGTQIGISGNSGWKKDKHSFEFQVIDTKIKAAINPLILLDSQIKAKKFVIREIRAINKAGNVFLIANTARLPAGTYTLYMDCTIPSMPYTTAVLVNGTLTEKTDYNALKTHKSKLCIQGDTQYDFEQIYAIKDGMRLAEVSLSKGKNTIDISIKDIGSHETSFHSILTVF